MAGLAMIIVGCTSVTEGSPKVNAADAPEYKASVSASIEESAASSSARESERQESLTMEAVHTSCEALSSSSVDAITAVNDYVKAFNESAADEQAKAGPAIDALNRAPTSSPAASPTRWCRSCGTPSTAGSTPRGGWRPLSRVTTGRTNSTPQ